MILFLRVAPGLSIALEERDRPEYRSHPLAVSRSGGRGLIHEINAPAQHYGVRPGMTTAQARHHCPDIRILSLDPARAAAVGEEICNVLRRFTPLVQLLEPGQAVCDLSGLERHWPDLPHLARSAGIAVREATDLSASIGIGANRLVAELASATAGAGSITMVEEGRERDFLADLPLTSLPEVDPNLTLTFSVLGLITAGQLAALPAAAVKNRFGALGERLHRYARGIDSRPVTPPAPKPAISARYECEDGTPEEALEGLRRLAREVSAELQQRGLQGRVVTLRVFWETVTPHPLPSFPQGARGRLRGDVGNREGSRSLALQGVGSAAANSGRGDDDAAPHPPLRDVLDCLYSSQEGQRVAKGPSENIAERGTGSEVGGQRHTWRVYGRNTALGYHSAQVPSPLEGEGGGGEGRFPIPYRIHSYGLPQPNGNLSRPLPSLQEEDSNPVAPAQAHVPSPASQAQVGTTSTMVRTPIDAEGPLEERAERLLLDRLTRQGERPPRLHAIELEVSEFARPEQGGFAELNRIGETGGLEGMSPERWNALMHGDEAWTARHGVTPFRHIAAVDPANVVTERRVQWADGLRTTRRRA